MDKPERMSEALWAGVLTKVRRMEEQELGYYRTLRPLYDELFPSYLQQLRTEFYRIFSPVLPDKPPTLDLVRAKTDDTVRRWVESLDAQLTAVEDEFLDLLDEELDEASEDGWLLTLWLLELQDAEVFADEDPSTLRVPHWDDMRPYLLAGAIGGIAYMERARAWRVQAVEKFRQMATAAVVSGGTWHDLEAVVSLIQRQYQQGLSALGADELYLARVQAEDRAVSSVSAGGYIQHLWLTRDDELVCETQTPPRAPCRPLHLTITDKRPIYDTHPRCRCLTIPLIASGAGGKRQTYAMFRRSHS